MRGRDEKKRYGTGLATGWDEGDGTDPIEMYGKGRDGKRMGETVEVGTEWYEQGQDRTEQDGTG